MKSGLKNFLIFIVLGLVVNTSPLILVKAAESTPSSTVKQKLDELKKEIASKAAALKKEISNKLENKAFVGVIKQKSPNSITIATQNGTRIININQDTVYQAANTKAGTKKSSFNLDSLKEEDNIAALGDVDDTGTLVAKKVVQLASENKNKKTILWGEVVSKSADILTVRDKELKNTDVSVLNTTEIKKGNEALKLKDVGVNVFVIVTGTVNDDKELDAALVYIIPIEGVLKPKATLEATPSAAVSPSPSSSPSASPKKR